MSKIFNHIFGGLLCFLLICSFSLLSSAQKTTIQRDDFKKLAGSFDEISAMRLPNPASLGTRSKSTMFPINSGDSIQSIEIPVDSTDNFKLMILSPNGKSLNLKVALPNGDFFDLRSEGFARQIKQTDTSYGLDGNQFPAEVFSFELLKQGVLRVQIEKPKNLSTSSETIGYLVASSDSPYRLYSYLDTLQTIVGREIGIFSAIFNNKENQESGQPDYLAGNIRDSRVSIQTPTGEMFEFPMFDNGNGAFLSKFVPKVAGRYTAQVFSKGIATITATSPPIRF